MLLSRRARTDFHSVNRSAFTSAAAGNRGGGFALHHRRGIIVEMLLPRNSKLRQQRHKNLLILISTNLPALTGFQKTLRLCVYPNSPSHGG
jgi:hypothetical protein